MKKRALTLFLALLAALMLTVPVWAETQPGDSFIYDDVGILSEENIASLEQMAEQVTWRYNCGVYVVVIQDYTDFAVKAFRIYLCMMVPACVNKACFIFLQAVGKALASTLLSMFREVVFGVGFALLLPVFFGLDGVLYSMPVSDILTFIISAVIIAKTYRELHTGEVWQA